MHDDNIDCAQAFARALLALAAEDPRVCVVLNDSTDTNHLEPFLARFPDRVVDVGIAEQNMIGVAAGLAQAGRVPFVHSAACFLTARAMEQIKIDVAYNRTNVKLCGFVGGLAYGPCGGTHHALEDIAWMRTIPGMSVIVPATPRDAVAALRAELVRPGPAYLRIVSKIATPEVLPESHRFAPSVLLRDGGDVALVGTGLLTTRLLEAAGLLAAEGIEASVLHVASIAPLDEEAIVALARRCGRVVVAEEHSTRGGLGGAVSEVLIQQNPVRALLIGVPTEWAPIGPASFLYEHYGLTAPRLARRVAAWLGDGHGR